MSQTKRNHYLPQTYLKHFLHEDHLFVYMKGEKFFNADFNIERRILGVKGEEGLKNIGLENRLYDPGVEGIKPNDIEEIFQAYGEDTYDSLINTLEDIPLGGAISRELKWQVATFMAAMRVRTPLFKAEIEQMDEAVQKHLLAMEFGRMTPEEVQSFYRDQIGKDMTLELATSVQRGFAEKTYKFDYPNGHFIKYALLMLEHHAHIFNAFNIRVLRTEKIFFYTSDNPVVYFVPRERINAYVSPRTLMSPYTELFFPLSKNLCVVGNRRGSPDEMVKATIEYADICNLNIACQSNEYIFAPFKTNRLDKYIENYIPFPFVFRVS
ncbi:MAG: DUF4238 domain-containing protein [Candidatus Pacebacteria bacterium]|nr:DUF4238 domain-containing protein [Candidatus Paceibacterota bacterium]